MIENDNSIGTWDVEEDTFFDHILGLVNTAVLGVGVSRASAEALNSIANNNIGADLKEFGDKFGVVIIEDAVNN
jgi:hypothetical protein